MAACKMYTQEFISRFVDREVSVADRETFKKHMVSCPVCAETEQTFRQLCVDTMNLVETHTTNIKRRMPPISAVAVRNRRRHSKAGVLKLASLCTAAVIFAAALLPWPANHGDEPSAIVNLVDTTGSSVMIITNPDTRHTIIWFSET